MPDDRKKILFVVNTMGRAGAERALCSMLTIFDRERFDVSVFSVINRGDLFSDLPKGVSVANKKPAPKSVMNKRGLFSIGMTIIKRLFKRGYIFRNFSYLKKNYKAQKTAGKVQFDKLFWHCLACGAPRLDCEFDLAVAYLEGAATYYVAEHVKARHKASFVHVDYVKTGYVKELDRPFFEKMERIFCVSDAVRNGFVSEFPEFDGRTGFFHNVILKDEVIEKSLMPGGFDDGFDGIRLLTVGRLHHQKAYDIAIEAMAKLVSEGKHDLRWYILGEGAERKPLEELIEKHGLGGKFILLGAKNNPYPYLRQCDYYIHATHFEGWSIAVGEALILKKLIIASDCAGNTEQIKHGVTGVIINLSAENIVSAINNMLSDETLRMRLGEGLKNHSCDYTEDLNMLYNMAEGSVT